MAAPSRQFIGAIKRYGDESAEKKAQLVTWKDAALASIAEGNGGHIASGSGNGLAFTMQISMTNAEWFTALDQALAWIDAGMAPPSKTIARVI